MYTQNPAYNKLSINRSGRYQKHLSQVHVLAFSEAQCLVPSHKNQRYTKNTLHADEWTKPKGKPLRGRLSCSPSQQSLYTSTQDRQKWSEGGTPQPADAASPCKLLWSFTLISPASPQAPQWGQKCPVVARPSLSYCHNYLPTADSRIPCSQIQGICCKTLSLEAISRRPEKMKMVAIKL